jgi:cytochrome c-type biogenesis protein
MIIVGVYVADYGWWEIQVLRGGPTEDPLIQAAAAVHQAVSNGVVAVGAGWLAVALLGLLGVIGMISPSRLFLKRRRQSDAATQAPQSSGSA